LLLFIKNNNKTNLKTTCYTILIMEEINIIDEFDQAKTQDSVFYNYLQNNTNVAQYLNNEQNYYC
jgi:hypothetical protein